MTLYTNWLEAVKDLRNEGFSNDFQLFGNDLLCVQEGFFIRAGEFSIIAYYKITNVPFNETDETIVFGIVAPYHQLKGILLNHYKNYTKVTPPVLVKKLNEFKARTEISLGDPH